MIAYKYMEIEICMATAKVREDVNVFIFFLWLPACGGLAVPLTAFVAEVLAVSCDCFFGVRTKELYVKKIRRAKKTNGETSAVAKNDEGKIAEHACSW